MSIQIVWLSFLLTKFVTPFHLGQQKVKISALMASAYKIIKKIDIKMIIILIMINHDIKYDTLDQQKNDK